MNQTKNFSLGHRVLAVFLCAILVLSLVPLGFVFPTAGEEIGRVVDPSTIDNWKNYFGSQVANTLNAGGVWGDKSVFTSPAGLSDKITMTDEANNFLVSLSALAANKTIVGYSAIPTDTMLVLDLSNSMSEDSINSMVQAANDALRRLYSLNKNNRVGIVLYSGTRTYYNRNQDWYYEYDKATTVLLPLDRYTGVANNQGIENFIETSYSGGDGTKLLTVLR